MDNGLGLLSSGIIRRMMVKVMNLSYMNAKERETFVKSMLSELFAFLDEEQEISDFVMEVLVGCLIEMPSCLSITEFTKRLDCLDPSSSFIQIQNTLILLLKLLQESTSWTMPLQYWNELCEPICKLLKSSQLGIRKKATQLISYLDEQRTIPYLCGMLVNDSILADHRSAAETALGLLFQSNLPYSKDKLDEYRTHRIYNTSLIFLDCLRNGLPDKEDELEIVTNPSQVGNGKKVDQEEGTWSKKVILHSSRYYN